MYSACSDQLAVSWDKPFKLPLEEEEDEDEDEEEKEVKM